MLSIFMGLQNANDDMFHGFGIWNLALEKLGKVSGNIVKGVRTDPDNMQ